MALGNSGPQWVIDTPSYKNEDDFTIQREIIMKCFLTTTALTLVLGTWGQLSHATVINFEDIAVPVGTASIVSSEISDGFLFTSPSDHFHLLNQVTPFADSGSTNLFIHDNGGANAGNSMTMTQVGGGTFSINIAWLSEGFIGFGAATVHVVGNIFGGGTVTTDFRLDGIIDGPGQVNDFQTFNFGANWTNLASVNFTGVGGTVNEHAWSIDNIEVNAPVPEPETYGMMLAGLGLMGFMILRRRNNEV
jgi:hypothetical protein